MKNLPTISLSMLISILIILYGCKKDEEDDVSPTNTGQPCPGLPTITYGGQVYHTVFIGNQCWMKENLNIGSMISGNDSMQDNGIIEKYCYEDKLANCESYGGLYQWDELMQYKTQSGAQGICPDGWHIPSDEEWKTLEGTVDSKYHIGDLEWDGCDCFRGSDACKNLKSTSGWYNAGNGLDKFGFCALPAGFNYSFGSFEYLNKNAYFWSSTENLDFFAFQRNLSHSDPGIQREIIRKGRGLSVRCIKD